MCSVYRDPSSLNLDPIEAAYLNEGAAANTKPTAELGLRDWLALFRHLTTWGMILGFFGSVYLNWVYLTWLPGYLTQARGMNLVTTGFAASVPFFCGFVGCLVAGWFSDKLTRKTASPMGNGVDQNVSSRDFGGKCLRKRGNGRLAGSIGRDTGSAPRLQRRSGRYVDDPPPRRTESFKCSPTTKIAADEVHIHHLHKTGLVGVRQIAHREPAGEVDRGPQVCHAVIEAADIGFICQVASRYQSNSVFVRKSIHVCVPSVRDKTACSVSKQCTDYCCA